jgi:hypothetical protein
VGIQGEDCKQQLLCVHLIHKRHCKSIAPFVAIRSVEHLLADAQQVGAHVIQCAHNEARRITGEANEVALSILMSAENAAKVASVLASEAKQEAMRLTTTIQTEITELREESVAIRQSISIEEKKILRLQNANTKKAELTQDEFRQRDAARKRAAYWTAKQQLAQSASQSISSPPSLDDCLLISNRSIEV